MTDCLFCKIVRNEIPAAKVYEDDKVIAFLDIKPVNLGHTLLISKEHYSRLSETPDEVAAEMMRVVPHLSKAVMAAVGAEGFNLGVNNGAVAAQSVDHVHFHLMPRLDGDGYQVWHGQNPLTPEDADRIANSIRQNL